MRILVVCSGNTCRSPLAAAMLADRLQREPEIPRAEVISAGTSAWNGSPVSEGSLLVGVERGLDLSVHRSQMLTAELVRSADLILTMSETHRHRVAELGGGGKAHVISAFAGGPGAGRDVPDPYGGDVAAYRETAAAFDRMLDGVIARLRADPPAERAP